MRMDLAAAVLSASCATVDLRSRPAWPEHPLCLIVTNTPTSWERDHVFIAADEWNDRLREDVIHVAPDCKINDEWVVFSFVHQLPEDCPSYYACTFFRNRVNGESTYREVVIDEWAPFYTLSHEIGHLLGCRHDDLDPPCSMGVVQ